ncbi:hypothetical protein [Nocardioides rubriscoriae]|uniref:hypothetical protein n=1 Tax=Nocardioides rubriscoriae TaxID=642762 RepID=UPI0011DF3A14|nr:hypothetical protein [Nocardioides rubriscoriae]
MDTKARPQLLLHVGAMKTGTTYVQNLVHDHRRMLQDAGWWVPDQRRVVQATRQLMGVGGAAVGSSRRPVGTLADAPLWQELLDEARRRAAAGASRGVVVSMEFLSFAEPHGADLVRHSAEGLDLQVVLTVRDAGPALPSQWQSLTRNGAQLSWPQFARQARTARERPRQPGAKAFRRTQDVPRMLEVWSGVTTPGSLRAITVPRGPGVPRTLLWERFCALLDLDAALTEPAAFDNPQLGYGSCELMRLVNAADVYRAAPRSYRKVVRRLTHDHLLPLRGEQTRPRLDEATAAFAADLNARTLEAVARVATLVGEPSDLPTTVDPAMPLDPGDTALAPPPAEVMRAAVALHAGAVALCDDLGLDLPAELRHPLPDGVTPAVAKVATVVGIAITGDVSHRPPARSG